MRANYHCKWTTLASVGKDIIEEEDGVSILWYNVKYSVRRCAFHTPERKRVYHLFFFFVELQYCEAVLKDVNNWPFRN